MAGVDGGGGGCGAGAWDSMDSVELERDAVERLELERAADDEGS